MENSYNIHPNKNKKGLQENKKKKLKIIDISKDVFLKMAKSNGGRTWRHSLLLVHCGRRLFIFLILAHSRREM